MNTPTPPRTLVILAFAAIYIVWGSTYLAIRIVVETLPAFTSAAARFLVAGALLMAFMAACGTALPTPSQWRHAAVTGILLLLGGNGLVVWAEKTISSGLAALLVALAPVWFALLDWLRPNGIKPRAKTVAGIIVGFIGVTLLVGSRNSEAHGNSTLFGALAVIVAGISWAAGSLYSKHSPNSGSLWMSASAQMICGGAGLAITGIFLGEPWQTNWSAISTRSLVALVYLVVFGSWIGFSAYVWLLKVSTASRVSTYAYVNPVIAVFLGWAVLDEVITSQMLSGALVVVAGVIIITIPQAAATSFIRRTFGWKPERASC